MLDKEEILKRLVLLDKKLIKEKEECENRFEIILVGGAAFMLKYDLNRYTEDIDSLKLKTKLKQFISDQGYKKFRINDRCERASILKNPDFRDRLEKIEFDYDFKFLDIYVMGKYDLIISKIGRGTNTDFDDIVESKILEGINKKRLDKLMEEAIKYVPIRPDKVRSVWESFKRKHF
jgi:hypothetical protein